MSALPLVRRGTRPLAPRAARVRAPTRSKSPARRGSPQSPASIIARASEVDALSLDRARAATAVDASARAPAQTRMAVPASARSAADGTPHPSSSTIIWGFSAPAAQPAARGRATRKTSISDWAKVYPPPPRPRSNNEFPLGRAHLDDVGGERRIQVPHALVPAKSALESGGG